MLCLVSSQVLQALHAMLEKSCGPDQPAIGGGQAGQDGQLPFRRSSSASQGAICWRNQLRSEVANAGGTGTADPVRRSPMGTSKRSRHMAGPQDEAIPARRPSEASVAPIACAVPAVHCNSALPAVGTWAGRNDASAMDTDQLAEEPPWKPEAPLCDRRSSSVDGRIGTMHLALEPRAFV